MYNIDFKNYCYQYNGNLKYLELLKKIIKFTKF